MCVCVCVTSCVGHMCIYSIIMHVDMYCIHVLCHYMLVYVNQSINTVFPPFLLLSFSPSLLPSYLLA